MTSFLNKTQLFSHIRSNSQRSRGYHVGLGEREIDLLAKDPALSKFKSHKQGVKRIKRIGDVLTVIVVAGCFYEIYAKATTREDAREQAKSS